MTQRSLCLSGGGSRGAWQVGSIAALLESGRSWNSIHGISVGALNGAFLAMYPPEQQAVNIGVLLSLWNNIESSNDIYKPWSSIKFVNYIMSMWKGSINSGSPLRTLVESLWSQEQVLQSGVRLTVGCTSLTTGKYAHFDQSHSNIQDYILASSHLPMVFPPLEIDGEQWVDGGIRHQIPFLDALRERPDEIDVVLTAPLSIGQRVDLLQFVKSTPRTAFRASEIMSDQIYANDYYTILRAIKNNKHIKINIYAPKSQPFISSMDFNPQAIQDAILCGYRETKERLAQQTMDSFSEDPLWELF